MEDGLREVDADDGTVLHVEVAGAARGLPVVFLHGSLSNRFAFRRIRPTIEPTRPVIATVLRGHEGATPHVPDDYAIATTEVDDLLTILDAAAAPTVDLVAHSTGGSIAVALAARHPERVRRMVLIEPTLLPLLTGHVAERVRIDCRLTVEAGRRGDHLGALRCLLDFVGGTSWRASTPAVRQRVADSLAPLAPLAGPHVAALAGLDVDAADIEALRPPTTLIYGGESAYFEAPIASRLAELRPDLGQLVVDGAGHNSHLERPDVVAATAAAFLATADDD